MKRFAIAASIRTITTRTRYLKSLASPLGSARKRRSFGALTRVAEAATNIGVEWADGVGRRRSLVVPKGGVEPPTRGFSEREPVLDKPTSTATPAKVNDQNEQDRPSESTMGQSGGNGAPSPQPSPRAAAIATLTTTLNELTAVGDLAGARVILQTISTLLATDDGAPCNVVDITKRRDGTR